MAVISLHRCPRPSVMFRRKDPAHGFWFGGEDGGSKTNTLRCERLLSV